MGRVMLLTLAAVLWTLASCATLEGTRPGAEAQRVSLGGSGGIEVNKPAGWVSRSFLASQNGYSFLFVPGDDTTDSCETVIYGLLLADTGIDTLSDLAAIDLQRTWMFQGAVRVEPLPTDVPFLSQAYDVTARGPVLERRFYLGTPTVTVLGLRSRRLETFDRAKADFGLVVASLRVTP